MTERVELHLHTTVSEDVSVITPKDVIKTAVQMGHKAVAVTCRNSVQDFPELETCQVKYGKDIKIIYGAEVYYLKDDTAYGIALLAKNEEGLKGLYRVLSSMQKWGDRKVVDWQVIADNRENLLCGALTWTATELGDALENENLYNYIAIVTSGYPQERERQWQFYTNSGIPVVAVGNCHYVDEEDRICRKVVQWVNAWDYDREITHYRTTNQMLQDFSYLGDNAAYEVVVTNSNLIADQIEPVFPSCGQFPMFTIPDAKEDLRRLCRERVQDLYRADIYGDGIPGLITERLEAELALTDAFEQSSIYMLLHRLGAELHKSGGYANVRGPLGSTLISYLLGISEINPLPAHYRCPNCKYAEFYERLESGYSFRDKPCPVCGEMMVGDGLHIPYETFTGLDWQTKKNSVEINVSASAREKTWQLLIDYIGAHRIARSGTTAPLGRLANVYVQKYQDSCGEVFTKEKTDQIVNKLKEIKRDEWSAPGGFMLLPESMEFEDITPITQLDTPECGIRKRTHLDFHEISHVLQKINILSSSIYDRITELHRLTETTSADIDYSDRNVYRLFRNLDTCGIPHFSTDLCKKILRTLVDNHRFNERNELYLLFPTLVRVLGMTWGVNAWQDNAEGLITTAEFSNLIGARDDIFLTLQKYGIDPATAHSVMETVRKGSFCKNTDENRIIVQKLLDAGVPQWYVDSMRKIGYLSNKAYAAHNTKTALTLAWFKVYHPKEFYTVTLRDLGAEEFLHYSNEALLQKLETIERCDNYKDKSQEAIELLLEARQRGIRIDMASTKNDS